MEDTAESKKKSTKEKCVKIIDPKQGQNVAVNVEAAVDADAVSHREESGSCSSLPTS